MSVRFAPIVRSRVAMPIAPRLVAFRSISSTPSYQKGPVDAAKDTLKKADELASKAALKGIDEGEKARDKINETVGSAKSQTESMKGEASKQAGKAKGEAEHAAGTIKGKTDAAMGEAKGKAEEIKHKHT
ncbi:uncharacterized protein N7498_003296 [Penicillium cinerascens]|uniref:LEA domain protein n=1 Tax=Penicillium cinerascens TaxID=70096 RepID=A0A9W9N1Z5_9EURO|nr:uncharacterized protein N7498_003296 [Penicillium cinerascens]KAJ5211650.1 hypothetical protein N7498_003296 [Penicillium cinerascens]